MKKKFLALLLALVMALALCPVSAFAADSDFVIENGVLTKYNGPGGDVVIPDGVTMIGGSAFAGCTGLTSVTIPDSVSMIGDGAFSGCDGLTNIAVSGGNRQYTSVDGVLFSSLKNILIAYPGGKQGSYTIPNSVYSIYTLAFYGCGGLTGVTIPDSVTTIGRGAFQFCTGLTSVTIPSSVTWIGGSAFASCTGLTSIAVSGGNRQYASVDGVLFSSDKKTLIAYPAAKRGSYTVPNNVNTIDIGAFYGCGGLTGVTIPDSVYMIGGNAFYGCTGLKSVTIPNSVTTIGAYAFYGCTGLKSVTIPNSVTTIGGSAFYGCTGLTSVTIPKGVTKINSSTFSGCKSLTSVTIPSSVTVIDGMWVFTDCASLSDVYYGGSKSRWDTLDFSVYVADGGVYRDRANKVTIHYNSTGPETPSVPIIVSTGLNPAATGTAYASTQAVSVDGKAVQFQYYALKDANGGETNYVKLRDLADVLDGTAAQFNVTWAEETGVGIQTKTAYSTRTGQEGKTPYSGDRGYRKGADTTLIDRAAVPLQAFFLTDDNGGDHTYYKLRDLGQALGFNVGWDNATETVFIETNKPYDSSN